MRDRNPQDSDAPATGQHPPPGTGPSPTLSAGDGIGAGPQIAKMATDHRAESELSGTPGAFVAALFAVGLLAFLFIRLSDHLQSHLKAGVIIGGGVALWLLLAVYFRTRIINGVARVLGTLGAAGIVIGSAFVVNHYLGQEGLKWSVIVVAGFYVLKLIFGLLERFAGSILIKIVIWSCLGAGAVFVFYRVGL